MSLLPNSNPTLEDVLGQQAKQATAQTQDQYAQARKRTVSRLAANGQLMGGTADYPLGDLDTGEASAESGIQDSLANALAGIPQEDWLNQRNYKRSYDLTTKIANANKPSTLDQVFQGIGSVGPTAAMFAAMV